MLLLGQKETSLLSLLTIEVFYEKIRKNVREYPIKQGGKNGKIKRI